jgi:hypothetical protein
MSKASDPKKFKLRKNQKKANQLKKKDLYIKIFITFGKKTIVLLFFELYF